VDWAQNCAVIIPCRNEEVTIGALVREIRAHLPAVFVVDDGSTDRTAHNAAEAGARVLSQEIRAGKGAALSTGWRHVFQRGFPWALSLDGDGQHAPSDIGAFLRHADGSGAALIIGNRMETPAGMPRLRQLVNQWMSAQISRMVQCPMPDTQCGFRLMHLGAWSGLRMEDAGHFQIESELCCQFAAAGHKVEFVPIQVIYRDERSKICPVRDTLRWIGWRRRWKERLRRMDSRVEAPDQTVPGWAWSGRKHL
jgi:glycosyltransferase involved in cell wall biosynthesis